LFAVPVTLTYKNQKAFNTLVGGVSSVALIMGFCAVVAVMVGDAFRHPDYSSRSSKTW
jgi:hypothetical protein